MAINRLTINGYGVLELNRVSFNLKGEVFADLPLASEFTALAPAENGMILAVNYAEGKVTRPTGGTDEILALHFSPEKEYDPSLPGLNKFCLTATRTNAFSTRNQVFYPRLGKLSVGDRFTTNTICYDTATFADNAALLTAINAVGTTPLYGYYEATTGAIKVTTTTPTTETFALQVVEKTTIPNGDLGLKFVVVRA